MGKRLLPNLECTSWEFNACLTSEATTSASVAAQKNVVMVLVKTAHHPALKINCFSWLIHRCISIYWQLLCAACILKAGVHSPVGHDPRDSAVVNSQRSAEGTDPHQNECQQRTAASAAWLTQAFLCLLAELNNPLRHNINTHKVSSEYSISPASNTNG